MPAILADPAVIDQQAVAVTGDRAVESVIRAKRSGGRISGHQDCAVGTGGE
jgi:hypothetical protein